MLNINKFAGVKPEANLMKIYHIQVVKYVKSEQERWRPQKSKNKNCVIFKFFIFVGLFLKSSFSSSFTVLKILYSLV